MTLTIEKIRTTNPIILNVANMVTPQHVADTINFIGGSPIMFTDPREAGDLTGISNALVLNLGSTNPEEFKSVISSGREANKKGIPVVVDPVAIGASKIRDTNFKLLSESVKIDAIRGNISEIAHIADVAWASKGIDAGQDSGDKIAIAKTAATKTGAFIIISGEQDIVTDGHSVFIIQNGNPQFATNVGAGDMLDGIIGVALATEFNLASCAFGTALLSVAGEIAAQEYPNQPYSFFNAVFDTLAQLDDTTFQKYAKIIQA